MNSIILLSLFGIAQMFLGFLKSKSVLLPLALLSLALALGVTLLDWNTLEVYPAYYNNMIRFDNFSIAFAAIMLVSTLLIVPLSQYLTRNNDAHTGEFYALILFALVGALMMVSFNNMLMLFIGIEILSISMYVLAGSDKDNTRSNEASLKYLLMGSFATGILLFGITLIYGASGSFFIDEIANQLVANDQSFNPLFSIGVLMLLIGLAFKLGAAPFHFWTPDVYEGTPTLFAGFMATVVKTASIAAFLRLFNAAFGEADGLWQPSLIGITALTLLIGNLTAVYQQSVKRMLAYSSISHAGYLVMALTAHTAGSSNAILFYSLAYSVATVSAFAMLQLISKTRNSEHFDAFNGLGRTNPLLAFMLTVAMCSLAGIPLTGGFFGKFFVFEAALAANLLWLVVIAIIMAAVGIYYYFRVVIAMYMKEPAAEALQVPAVYTVVLIISTVITLLLGIAPGIASFWI